MNANVMHCHRQSVKHSICTRFPKDKNCDICQRNKITSAPCRKRTGTAVPRAEKFGDLKTADHKVLSEGCEFRNYPRYAVVVLSWKHPASTPHRSETYGIVERAVRKVKKGTSAVLLQSGLDENGEQIPWNAFLICETFKISCLMGKHHTRNVLETI